MRPITSLAIVLLLAAACSRADTPAADTSSRPAQQTGDANAKAAAVSDAIAANPAAADSILKANGYTPESLERELYDIAADSSRSAAYAAVKKP